MITYRLERVDEAYDGITHGYLEDYHREVANANYPLFGQGNIEVYKRLEALSVLRLMVARADDASAFGFCTALVNRSYQSGAANIAQIDMLYVRPSKRGLFCGLLLLKHMIERLRDEGITQFRATSSARLDSSSVWKWLGFEETGTIWEKCYRG